MPLFLVPACFCCSNSQPNEKISQPVAAMRRRSVDTTGHGNVMDIAWNARKTKYC